MTDSLFIITWLISGIPLGIMWIEELQKKEDVSVLDIIKGLSVGFVCGYLGLLVMIFVEIKECFMRLDKIKVFNKRK